MTSIFSSSWRNGRELAGHTLTRTNAPESGLVDYDEPEDREKSVNAKQQGFRWDQMLAPIIVGVLLRLAFVATPDRLTGDEIDHFQGSVEVSRSETPSVVPKRPPAYLYFGGTVLRVFGEAPIHIRIVQAILEGVTITLIILLGRSRYGNPCGIVAGWIYALSPEQISFSHTLWTETPLSLMLVVGWMTLMRLHERPGILIAILTGGAWGVLALLKPYNLYFFPILATLSFVSGGMSAHWRRATPRFTWTGVSVVMQLCVVFPWCDFSAKPFVIISSQGQRVLEVGTNYYPPPQFDFSYLRDVPEAQRRKQGRRVSTSVFVIQNPGLFTVRGLEKMTNLWAPNSFLLRHIYSGHYGDPYSISPWVRIGLSTVTILCIGTVLILAAFGMMGAKFEFFEWSIVCCLVCTIGMISLTVSLSRYRVPLMPFLMIFAAYFLTKKDCGEAIRCSETRKIILGCSVSLLMFFWAYRLPSIVQALW